MSIVFSKNKEKRSRSSSSEANSSFVKNVTSRVSGLLPATITKWFSSPSTSSANGSAPTADATDSSTEDEGPDSPATTQPPTKRMRYSSPGKFNHYNTTETNCVGTNIDTLETCGPYGTVQSPPGRATFRRDPNFVSTPLRSPVEDSVVERSEKDTTMFKSQHSISTIGPSVATKRKSLFDSPSNSEASIRACAKTSCNTMRDPNQPCFKPSLLGSPFYPGRTMYGGASASYINKPNIKQRKNTFVNESSSSDNTVSHSTRRIMDLLEHYSSPLNEAKRIPQYTRTSFNESASSSYDSVSPYVNKTQSYKTQELHIPGIASILRLKQRSRLINTTTAARQIIASHSSTSDYLPYPTLPSAARDATDKESNSKFTTKVKSRLTKQKLGSQNSAETELPAPVNLPSVSLQIDQDKLPKFSFEASSLSKPTSVSAPSPSIFTLTKTTSRVSETKTTTKIIETPIRKPETIPSSNLYKFSSPVRISSDAPQNATTPPKFTFSSPERSIDKTRVKEKNDDSCVVGTPKETENKIEMPKSKDWKCPSCWVLNKPDVDECVCCQCKKPSEGTSKPAKCTVCKLADSQPQGEKCVNCEKIKVNNISKALDIKPAASSKWKCNDCWVDNEDSAESCVCCGGKNPKKSTAAKQNAVSNDIGGEWKCDDCWIKNKSSADKCAACGGARPGSKPSAAPEPSAFTMPAAKPPDNTFKNIINAQTDKWECSNCLVRNDSDKTKCVCCETERLGAAKEPEKTSFKFGVNTTFKFGIDPKLQEANTAKPVEIKPASDAKSKVEESETNNNILPKTPTFTFGLPAKKTEDRVDTVKKVEEKSESTPKMNFTFGIPKSTPTTTSPVVTPVFGIKTNKLPESTPKASVVETEKPQEVPKIEFTVPKTQEAPKTLPNLFTSPVSSQVIQSTTLTASPLLNSSITAGNKDTPVKPLTLPPAATTTEAKQPPAFSFSAAGIKPAVNLFGSPTTTSSNTGIPFAPPLQSTPATSTVTLFQKPEATTASGLSMFQKSDPSTTTVSLFQKSEPTTTTAPPSLGATAPLFSFGTNTQTAMPPPEKPKFSFSFGTNNKTETPSLFKPTFGAPTDNNSSNKFSLPTGNALGSSNALASNNPLGGNGLSTGTSLSSNVLSGGNGLSTNPLSGGSDLSSNPLLSGNNLQSSTSLPAPTGGIFGANVQKENIWSASNNTSNNLFVSNATTNSLQKPPAFTFGTSTFNTPNAAPTFGTNTQSTPVFGMPNQNSTSQTSLFSSPVQNQSATNLFGTPQPASNPAPSLGMFGTPNVGATPNFGSPNPSNPSFETPSLTPAPAPTFNFGQPPATGIFGFGQQQPAQQAGAPAGPGGVYSFGGAAGGAPQFNMGVAPNAAGRRMRKAVRRNLPR